MLIELNALKARKYYWARELGHNNIEIVQISTVFGEQPEFHTAAVMGSDEHRDLGDFEYLAEISAPMAFSRNENLSRSASAQSS